MITMRTELENLKEEYKRKVKEQHKNAKANSENDGIYFSCLGRAEAYHNVVRDLEEILE